MSAQIIPFPRRERIASPAQLLIYTWASVVLMFGLAAWWWSPHK